MLAAEKQEAINWSIEDLRKQVREFLIVVQQLVERPLPLLSTAAMDTAAADSLAVARPPVEGNLITSANLGGDSQVVTLKNFPGEPEFCRPFLVNCSLGFPSEATKVAFVIRGTVP